MSVFNEMFRHLLNSLLTYFKAYFSTTNLEKVIYPMFCETKPHQQLTSGVSNIVRVFLSFSGLYFTHPCTWTLDVLTLVFNKTPSPANYSSHFVIVLKLIVGFNFDSCVHKRGGRVGFHGTQLKRVVILHFLTQKKYRSKVPWEFGLNAYAQWLAEACLLKRDWNIPYFTTHFLHLLSVTSTSLQNKEAV